MASTKHPDNDPPVAKDHDKPARHPDDPAIQPPSRDYDPRPIGVAGKRLDDGERDPDTVAEEQRRRSDEIAKVGTAKWVDDHDERAPEDRTNRQIPGVAPPAPKEARK
jgi:hypothetical protein